MKPWLVLASILMLWRCASSDYAQLIVRNQASYDFDCTADQIKVAPLGNHRYTAEGCFKREVYVCKSGFFGGDDGVQCAQQIAPLPLFEGDETKDDP